MCWPPTAWTTPGPARTRWSPGPDAEASRINDVVMERAAAYMKEGMTEREVADYIVAQYAAEGCDSTAFLPIVSYGAHAADPTTRPTDPRRLGTASSSTWAAGRTATAPT